MAYLSPGTNPVADHTWCCEHPEPWHYFQKEPYLRLLSAIERVYRVDPVEASWSLGILEWTATTEAIPLLLQMIEDRAVTPKQQRRIRQILHALRDPAKVENTGNQDDGMEAMTTPQLLSAIQQVRDPIRRKTIVDRLASAFSLPSNNPHALDILCEILSEQHTAGEALLFEVLSNPGRLFLTPDGRAQLFLATTTWDHPRALEAIRTQLENSGAGIAIYDTYEGIKALCLNPTTKPEPTHRFALNELLFEQAWFHPKSAEDAGQISVIHAALLEDEAAVAGPWKQRLRWPGKSGIIHRYRAEQLGFVGGARAERQLTRMLRHRELSVRRQSARSLCQIGSPTGISALIEHVALDVTTGRVPFDIEGVDVVRHAIDAIVRSRHPNGTEVLTTLLETPDMRADDLPGRVAVALCVLKDHRCMRLREDNGLPEVLHAALTPLPSTPGSLLDQHTRKAALWLTEHLDAPLTVPSSPLTHLDRVRLSQDMISWWLTHKVTSG